MRRSQFRGFTVSLNRTSVKRIAVLCIVGIIAIFILTGMLTSFGQGTSLASSSVHGWTSHLAEDALVYVLGMQNPYFTQALPSDSERPKLMSVAFEMATSINPDDPRSLLGRELPGFALFDGHIVVAGEGTDYTTMPIESSPPMEVLMAEREAAEREDDDVDKQNIESQTDPEMTTDGREVVHIIHSHSRESFFPELNNADAAHHPDVNITLVGERLGQALEKRGIGVDVDKTDVEAMLHNRGWQYSQSYDASREIVQDAMNQNDDLEFFFDIHRDSQPRDITTVNINGEDYGRTFFVIGQNHNSYEQNLELAKELHDRLEKDYPGLSRGVVVKGGAGSNGRYNQDLSENSLLIEFGGVDNTLQELYRSAEAMAEVISEYYWE
ncbi:stage II sporulation protein P [Desertibacillus haloalkaliphilus]|uniref:stage II sporulation protein P n=1 Tax=Desertibacillus haloalkaliphilus TaxID=1328930 RepID=UPI001C27E785|nr:stage II sporulation protein P [Desertibacillus haloalkaliphilus]MBU8905626.1 stage II sporulation protein P [Desertibacillus haloalkaliphilus]